MYLPMSCSVKLLHAGHPISHDLYGKMSVMGNM